MPAVFLDITMSLDGYVAGPDPGPEQPLGKGGEGLHEWAFGLASFQERHGRSGGETNADDEVVAEGLARQGAVVMGRGMFGGGGGPWGDDPWEGWWGDDPPFRMPVFVVTHHAREPLTKQGGTTFTFVTEGMQAAVDQARSAAGEKDVLVAGGAAVAQQALASGLLDDIQIHLAPMLIGGGVRLFDRLPELCTLEKTRVIDSPGVTHLRFDVGSRGA
ncbi:MAG: dihydrofolate reductase family protein [Solirubrobacteraceae bacterium]